MLQLIAVIGGLTFMRSVVVTCRACIRCNLNDAVYAWACRLQRMKCWLALGQVIPMLAGDATDQTPPDLPSFLFKERIVYLVRICAMCCTAS